MGAFPRRHAADAVDPTKSSGCARSTTRSTSTKSGASICRCRACCHPCRILAAAVSQRQRFLSRVERGQDAVHHRHRRLGRRRQIDHGAYPEGAAVALAVEPEGRSRHHRRLPLSQRGCCARKPDGAQGLSRKLRYRRAAALPVGDQGRQPNVKAPVYSHLTYDVCPTSSGSRSTGPDILIFEGINVLQSRRCLQGRQDRADRLGLLRFLDLYRCRRKI
jgi:hypothetical protein